MNNGQTSIRDALYEAPGPKTRRGIAVGTVVVLLLLAALIYGVIRQFAINGQLDARYWSFFTRYTTWRFIGNGLAGTLTAALTAGVITFFAGLLLMLGRISGVRPLEWLCTALIEFSRGKIANSSDVQGFAMVLHLFRSLATKKSRRTTLVNLLFFVRM